jgi:CRP-like cAMP-binding protein
VDPPANSLFDKLARLGALDDEDKAGLAALPVQVEQVEKHRHLIREGDRPEQCCLLLNGFACRYKVAADGARQIVSLHLAGDLLDIQHLLLEVADHSVQAITDVTVAWIPKAPLIRLASERPAIGKALWRDSLIDASVFREWVLNVGRRDAKSRVAHMLCELAARCNAAGIGTPESFELPLTQEQIADATGLTSVHVNRTLKALEADGAISRERTCYRIGDWNRFRQIADFDAAYLHAAG